MELKQFLKLGKFDKPVDENSLVLCLKCEGLYGVKKWIRIATAAGAVCPGCGTLFQTEQVFGVKQVEKLAVPEEQPEEDEKTKPQSAVKINPDGSKTYQELNLRAGAQAKAGG